MRTLVILIFVFLSLTPTTFAQTQPVGTTPVGNQPVGTTPGVGLVNPLNVGNCTPDTCLMVFLNKILDFVIQIGTIVVILMMVYIGYLFVTARGNDAKITEARQALLWTVVGALILIGAKAISTGIEATVRALSVGK